MEEQQNDGNTFQVRVARARTIFISNCNFTLSCKVRNKMDFSNSRAHVIGKFSVCTDVLSVTSASVGMKMI